MTGAIYVAGALDYETRKRVSTHSHLSNLCTIHYKFQLYTEIDVFLCGLYLIFLYLIFIFLNFNWSAPVPSTVCDDKFVQYKGQCRA